MVESNPVFDNLITFRGSYGLESAQELVNNSIRRFTYYPVGIIPPPEAHVLVGPSMSGKSSIILELPKIIRGHSFIKEWQEREEKEVGILVSQYEDGLPKIRTGKEVDHEKATQNLEIDIAQNLRILNRTPGFLLIEVPAIQGLLNIGDESIGWERGTEVLWNLFRRTGSFAKLRYELSATSVTSEDRVKKIAVIQRTHRDELKNSKDARDLRQVLNAVLAHPVEEMGEQGARPDISIAEDYLVTEIIRQLGEKKIINLPPKTDNRLAEWLYPLEARILYYLPWYFGEYLKAPADRVYCGINIKRESLFFNHVPKASD